MHHAPLEQRGFTLAESCLVCAVLAIVAGMALPSFQGSVERHTVLGSAAQFETDVQFARATAEAGSLGVLISFHDQPAGSCYVVHTGAAGDCRCDAAGHPVCDGEAEALRTVFLPAEDRVRLQSNVEAMRFDGHRHTISPTGSVTLSAAGGGTLRQIVNIMGRTRSCSPDKTMPGYQAC
jgi:type IV fimbrial biogenesis protein FimT